MTAVLKRSTSRSSAEPTQEGTMPPYSHSKRARSATRMTRGLLVDITLVDLKIRKSGSKSRASLLRT